MGMMLMIHAEKCSGCRNCELACSMQQEGNFRPKSSRIKVHSWEREGFSVPLMCQQCKDASCISVCMPHALARNPETGLVELSSEKCIGCKMCVQACQFGTISWDFQTDKILKCDTCGSDPACAAICPTGAIEWVDDALAVQGRKKSFAEKLKNAYQGA